MRTKQPKLDQKLAIESICERQCPFCGEEHCFDIVRTSFDHGSVSLTVTCLGCHKNWVEYYELKLVTPIERVK